MEIEKDVTKYIDRLSKLFLNTEVDNSDGIITLNEGVNATVENILKVKTSGNKVLIIGNGGSAAIASHIHVDLCNSVGVKALVFGDIPLSTALSNDYGYQYAFERFIKLWIGKEDLLIAISSSGQSENILRAVRYTKDIGAFIVTLSGFKVDNPLRKLGDINFYVNSDFYGYVESAHSILAHYLTDRASV
jgi:D-sedoheptulose 7-phosphate isomerase